MTLLLSVLEQGMIYAIMALGMYITYKILDFPDMTVDGSFPMGAAITAILITKGMNPLWTLPLCMIAGAGVGVLTGLIHVKLKVRDLLSGIIMMTALYSVNLTIAGRANVPIYQMQTIFDNKVVNALIPQALIPYKTVIIVTLLALFMKVVLDVYMRTKSGYLLRAVGDNDTLVTSLGVDKGLVKIIGLAIANALVALSGCIFAQQQRFFDISVGTGTAVIGLASVIIGTSLLKKVSFLKVTTGVVIGSLLYKSCVALAVRIGFPSSYLKLITAVLFLLILVLGTDKKKTCRKTAGRKEVH
ncbi:MAG: ABC transporter permease [Lachnospiraceae bacterium]